MSPKSYTTGLRGIYVEVYGERQLALEYSSLTQSPTELSKMTSQQLEDVCLEWASSRAKLARVRPLEVLGSL